MGCENSFMLRNRHSSAKLKITFNIPLFFYKYRSFELRKGFRKRKSHSNRLFIFLPEPDDARTSGHLFRSSLPAKFRQSDMARTREPNLPLLPAANESRERHLLKAPPLNLRGQKLLHLRRSPHHRILRRGGISLGQGAVPCKREPGSKA